MLNHIQQFQIETTDIRPVSGNPLIEIGVVEAPSGKGLIIAAYSMK